MHRYKLATFFLIFALTISLSCREESSSSNEPAGIDRAGDLSVGDPVPDVKIPQLLQAGGRESVTLEELRGSTIVLEFWATWCPPCRDAIPHMNDLVDEFSGDDKVRFISVTDEPESTVTKFTKGQPMHVWIGLDKTGELHEAFGVQGIPTTVIIDAEGKLAKVAHPMQLDAQTIRQIHKTE